MQVLPTVHDQDQVVAITREEGIRIDLYGTRQCPEERLKEEVVQYGALNRPLPHSSVEDDHLRESMGSDEADPGPYVGKEEEGPQVLGHA